MGYQYSRDQALAFARRIKEMGFTVYLAKAGHYGFITDDTESRVLSFAFDGPHDSLGGNYGPPSHESGIGWRLADAPEHLTTPERVKAALYATPGLYCGRGWRYLSTVGQYLGAYGPSSQFAKLEG